MSNEDTLRALGKLIPEGADAQRDAVHIAVVPMVAPRALKAGEPFALNSTSTAVGIVDPFLPATVPAGARFWLYLYPGSITSLRHEWTHPAFAQQGRPALPANCSAEEKRLREIAAEICIGYFDMMQGADEWIASQKDKWPEYLTQNGSDSWRDGFPQYVNEFWRCYSVVRGVDVPDEHRQSFFSCSC